MIRKDNSVNREIYNQFVEEVRSLSDYDRKEVFEEILYNEFCRHCFIDLKRWGYCHCWNDE